VGGTIVIAALGAGLGLSMGTPKSYSADAKVVIGRGDLASLAQGLGSSAAPTDLEREADTNLAMVKLDSTARRVIDQLQLPISPTALINEVTTSYDGNSNIVSITASDRSPDRAASIANAFALEYRNARRARALAAIASGISSAQSQLTSLGPSGQDTSLGRALTNSLVRLRTAATLQTGDVQVVQNATPPSSASYPKPLRSALIALMLGLALAVAAMLARERLDARLYDDRDVAEAFGLALLASLPRRARRWRRWRRSANGSERESWHRVAARLLFAHGREKRQVIMIAAASGGDSTTRVTFGIAQEVAELGGRVIAIEADLGRGAMNSHNLKPASGGLASVLEGQSSLERELLALESGEGRAGPGPEVLPAGSAPPKSRALLSGPGMERLVREAVQRADLVLLEAPPLLHGADAVALMPLVDAVVVVATAGKTTAKEATESMELMEDAGVEVLGLVVVHGEGEADDAPPGWPRVADNASSSQQAGGPAVAAVYTAPARASASTE
jgi:Mrp family chromosome partitioning ATPase